MFIFIPLNNRAIKATRKPMGKESFVLSAQIAVK